MFSVTKIYTYDTASNTQTEIFQLPNGYKSILVGTCSQDNIALAL